MEEKKVIDWKGIEREYRAGIRTLRAIAEEYGITHGAINKRAKAEGWPRDLTEKIKAAAQDKVSKAMVSKLVSKEDLVTERQVVEANAEIVARADLINRKDVLLALDVSRSQLEEVAVLCEPEFRQRLVALGEACDMSTETRADKANELYRYVISLSGRVKLSKEIAAAHGVYIPMQRKILKLDADSERSQSSLDALMAKINAAAE